MNALCPKCMRSRSHLHAGFGQIMCSTCGTHSQAPEVRYVLLNAGDKLKAGDSVWVTTVDDRSYWRDVPQQFAGKVVEPNDPPCRRREL